MASNLLNDGLQPNSHGLRPKGDGLQPNSDGLQNNSHGLQPKSDGLQVKGEGVLLYFNSQLSHAACPTLDKEVAKKGRLLRSLRFADS